ncbi:MAG: restriction endonuclease subunit [Bacteroidetes bacterium]|nr:restriction endonuclease subunit [Bacteroidota bacterium]
MKLLKIKNKWFEESDLRMDAEFHLSDGPNTLRLLKKSAIEKNPLTKVCLEIFKGQIFKRCYVYSKAKGFPFLTASDMIKLNIHSGTFLSKKYTLQYNQLKLEAGWILVSRSGTLGITTYTNKNFEGILGTDDLIRIKPNSQNIRSGYLYAYLASKYGHSLLTQSSYGGVVKHIEPHHIENLPVPRLAPLQEKTISDLIEESSLKRAKSTEKMTNAVEILEEIIGPSSVNLKYQVKMLKSSDIINSTKRLDALCVISNKKLRKEQSKAINWDEIYSYSKNIFVGNRGKRMYVNNGIPFLSSSDMLLFNAKKYSKKISKNTPGLENMIVQTNDILISRSGTVGKSILIGDELNGAAISEHAIRLVIDKNKIAPEYVFCFLNTHRGKMALETNAFGSVIITLNEDIVGNVMLPEIDKKDQNKIITLIKEYLKCLDYAIVLENKAVDMIEKEIESWQK